MNLKIVEVSHLRGVFLLRTNPYQPLLVPFIYTVSHLRNLAKSTVQSKLIGLKYLYTFYAERYSIDVDEFLINRKHQFILDKLNEFVYWLTYSETIIGLQTREIYLFAIRDYLIWSCIRYQVSHDFITSVNNLLNSHIRKYDSATKTSTSFTKGEFDLILKFSNPLENKNPFKSKYRNRNFIIISLLQSTGIRLGELLNLKCSNIHDFEGRHYIEIIRDEDDLNDSRLRKPSIKNNQSLRTVSITQQLYLAINDYIICERRPIRGGKKMKLQHGFLFTSDRGSPLSYSLIGTMLTNLKKSIKANGEHFQNNLTPHSFRYFFAETYLSNLIEVQGLEIELAKDHLRAICGWSISSIMPNYYAKKYIAEKANKLNLKRIEKR